MENRNPVEGQLGSDFWRSVIIVELWWPEVANLEIVNNFCVFLKTTP